MDRKSKNWCGRLLQWGNVKLWYFCKKWRTLAIKHINAAGGALGTDLEAVSQDDACDSVKAAKAARVAENMIAENVIAVIGHICNNSTEAALPSYASANIPVISAASTNPNLTNEGKYPNFFRTISHDASQAQLQVEFAVKALGIKKAAVIFDQVTTE